MKQLFALVLVVLAVLSTCCSSAPLAPPKPPDVTTVTVSRDLELVLHVDTDFDALDRAMIASAARSIGRMTHDRARLRTVVDLDVSSGVRVNVDDWSVIRIASSFEIVRTLEHDAGVKPTNQLIAATVLSRRQVYVIWDRVRPGFFEEVVMHELGHVIGFPDLDESGAVMSGVGTGEVPLGDWTPADVALCMSSGYCD